MNSDLSVICPYNKSHIIATSRLQKHLIKCEKQYPPGYLSICPYNATHRMPNVDIGKHIMTCPSKVIINNSAIPTQKNAKVNEKPNITAMYDEDNNVGENWEVTENVDVEVLDDYEDAIETAQVMLDERVHTWVQQTDNYRNTIDNMSCVADDEASETVSLRSGFTENKQLTALQRKYLKLLSSK